MPLPSVATLAVAHQVARPVAARAGERVPEEAALGQPLQVRPLVVAQLLAELLDVPALLLDCLGSQDPLGVDNVPGGCGAQWGDVGDEGARHLD